MLPIIAGLMSLGGTIYSDYRRRKDIEKQNKYNSFANQAQLMRNAGLSPSLMYGGGGAVGGATQSNVPNVSPDMGIAGALNSYQTAQLQEQQLKMMTEDLAIRRNERAISDEESYMWLRNLVDKDGNQLPSEARQRIQRIVDMEKMNNSLLSLKNKLQRATYNDDRTIIAHAALQSILKTGADNINLGRLRRQNDLLNDLWKAADNDDNEMLYKTLLMLAERLGSGLSGSANVGAGGILKGASIGIR